MLPQPPYHGKGLSSTSAIVLCLWLLPLPPTVVRQCPLPPLSQDSVHQALLAIR